MYPNQGRSWLFTVKDYCESSMLLVAREGARKRTTVAGNIEGHTLGIHFSVPLEAREQHFRLEGEIVRVMDSGVGIRFPHSMASDAMDALDTYSNKTPAEAAPPSQPKGSVKREGKATAKSAASKEQSVGASAAKAPGDFSPNKSPDAALATKAPGNPSLNKGWDTAFLSGG